VSSNVTVAWITEETGFLAQREAWNRLVSGAGGRSVFLRHEWFDAAWQWRKHDGCSLRIGSFLRGGALIGICPLLLHPAKVGGFPARKLEFLSVPDTQFCDIVCDRNDGPTVRAALAAALKDLAGDWDILDLKHLSEDSVANGLAVDGCLAADLDCQRADWDKNPFIDITSTWDDFYGRRTRSLKKANNLATNRLRKAGALEIEWLRGEQNASDRVDKLLGEFVALSARSWKKETALTLDNPGPGAFIHRLTQHALEQGWLSMWGLRLDGTLVAMEYQLVCSGDVFALRADFDQSLETISPGSYLSWQLLQRLFTSGLTTYWMGPGANVYKSRWTDQGETLFRVEAYSPAARGRLHRLNQRFLRPAARRGLAALRRAKQARTERSRGDE